jgi:protein-S-isoprenylcysteine O-methyltransferase Ste14
VPWFRQAAPSTARSLVTRTALQVVVFWGVFLFVLPPFIARFDRLVAGAPGIPRLTAAALLFVVASSLGIASALAMVLQGRGTPLPIDGPRHLVVRGPYARVRNPMAVAGLAQGAAVALWLGSPLVLAYVIAGGVLWHGFVRPLEESHLLATFGAEYGAYRARVPLWLPWRTSAQPSDGARAGDSPGRP